MGWQEAQEYRPPADKLVLLNRALPLSTSGAPASWASAPASGRAVRTAIASKRFMDVSPPRLFSPPVFTYRRSLRITSCRVVICICKYRGKAHHDGNGQGETPWTSAISR